MFRGARTPAGIPDFKGEHMARQSEIDKRIDVLHTEIEIREHAIAVLRSVQTKKPAKVRKPKFPTAKAAGVEVVTP